MIKLVVTCALNRIMFFLRCFGCISTTDLLPQFLSGSSSLKPATPAALFRLAIVSRLAYKASSFAFPPMHVYTLICHWSSDVYEWVYLPSYSLHIRSKKQIVRRGSRFIAARAGISFLSSLWLKCAMVLTAINTQFITEIGRDWFQQLKPDINTTQYLNFQAFFHFYQWTP